MLDEIIANDFYNSFYIYFDIEKYITDLFVCNEIEITGITFRFHSF